MTVYQIMQSEAIVSFVPYKVKADAIKNTLGNELSNLIPSTMLKTHDNWVLYLDEDSASLADKSMIKKHE